jgi:hypothetical protein
MRNKRGLAFKEIGVLRDHVVGEEMYPLQGQPVGQKLLDDGEGKRRDRGAHLGGISRLTVA